MNDRPSAEELLEAVGRFLSEEVVPALSGHLKYQARVAANVVAIVGRELAGEEERLVGEWHRLAQLIEGEAGATPPAAHAALRADIAAWTERLCERIRAGEADAGPWRAEVLTHLRRTVADKLAVAKGTPAGAD